MKKRFAILCAMICLAAAALWLLPQADFANMLKWWAAMLVLGMGIYLPARRLFSSFADGGWFLIKTAGLVFSGYLVWALSCGGMRFTAVSVRAVTYGAAALIWAVCLGLYAAGRIKKPENHPVESDAKITMILFEELLFLAVMIFWTYVIGFRPEASGTEKFMDYGFMAAMDRSTSMPAADMWFAGKALNYYYGGQYFAVYLAKLAGTPIRVTYNLARVLTASLVTVLSFSIIFNLVGRNNSEKRRSPAALLSGLTAAGGVSCAGNVHYLLYGMFGKLFRLAGSESYWFPESTRFIGHNPATADECIHEFPSYSFVLGDVHAHMANLPFVLLFLGLLASWFIDGPGGSGKADDSFGHREGKRSVPDGLRGRILLRIADPRIIICAFLTGMFRWTNYWDFVIYLTVLVIAFLVDAVRILVRGDGIKPIPETKGKPMAAAILREGAVLSLRILMSMAVAVLASRPFMASFDMMVSSVGRSVYHTEPRQFLILWGLPLMIILIFTFVILHGMRKGKHPDDGSLFVWMTGVCAAGLVFLPEMVYVIDIYGDGLSRANTMFKLTYQAFVLFGLCAGYVLPALIRKKSNIPASGTNPAGVRIICVILAAVQLLTFVYLPYSVKCWFGDIRERDERISLDAEAFLDADYHDDAEAISYLEENISGQPVVLEADGDSYSGNCRVSAMTGLPTVLGWYVHEWLWRENVPELNRRRADIREIYTSDDRSGVQELLNKYHVSFIFVGSCERDTYEGEVNDRLLRSLGDVVFTDDASGTYIVRVV